MKILELLVPVSSNLNPAAELTRILRLPSYSAAHPLLADDELLLAKRLGEIAADPFYKPSTLVLDFIAGINAKLAVSANNGELTVATH